MRCQQWRRTCQSCELVVNCTLKGFNCEGICRFVRRRLGDNLKWCESPINYILNMSEFPFLNVCLNEKLGESSQSSVNSNVQSDDSVNSDGEDEFYFESDHVALKNNKDYRELLKTVAILEAQRYRALKDIDTIISLKKQVKENPIKFVEMLTNGTIQIPEPQIIPPMPNIDWNQYNIPNADVNKTSAEMPKTDTASHDPTKSKMLVRGRVFDESKPETFNQLWTVEEQQRLEELLIKYPPEEVETNRWRKIAAELGNRTAKQVCSRVQKYFLKLQKAGLPVPGRAPKAHAQAELGKRSAYPYQRRFSRPTTFFPSQDVPVPLAELEDTSSVVQSPSTSFYDLNVKTEISGGLNLISGCEDSVANEKVKNIQSSRKLDLLRKVLEVKEQNDYHHLRHIGFKCDFCNDEPITGVLWTCVVCPAVDFCTDCVVAQLDSSNPHPLSHNIIPVKEIGVTKVIELPPDSNFDEILPHLAYQSPDITTNVRRPPKKKWQQLEDSDSGTNVKLENIPKPPPEPLPEDEFDLFGRHVAGQLRQMNIVRSLRIQTKIQYLIYKERMEELQVTDVIHDFSE
ncbi:ZZ-type zinc finger-containing protein 3 [Gryllus bimaculatus]|nr:ZZ-type zinc finger-containing protein 3 [Gryllus bimaculatus]